MDETTKKIAELNDLLRETFIFGGKVLMTQGINAFPPEDKDKILYKVRAFNEFTEDNDPYGEHDFGSFDHRGKKIFWKIDYYAPCMKLGSEDPADPARTVRVLTIMLAEEY